MGNHKKQHICGVDQFDYFIPFGVHNGEKTERAQKYHFNPYHHSLFHKSACEGLFLADFFTGRGRI
jgi:hypothetical protein